MSFIQSNKVNCVKQWFGFASTQEKGLSLKLKTLVLLTQDRYGLHTSNYLNKN